MAHPSGKMRVMIVFGTRPEVIKLGPVVKALRARRGSFSTLTCFTAQHRQMCDPLLRLFSIEPDYDLDIMTEHQSLNDIVTRTMQRLDPILANEKPHMVLVQGDTTSAFAAALVSFYRGVPVGHVEAGLRTYDLWNPYPEELNRQLISRIAELDFAPTERARRALLAEGISGKRVFVTGNTVIDALMFTAAKARTRGSRAPERGKARRKLILVTAHRRESFGAGIAEICAALLDLVERNDNLEIFLPVHPNPAVKGPIERALSRHPRITLSPPLDYVDLVRIMQRSTLVLTDSGGLQEEAPALGKPVVVMRDETERPEIVEAGGAVLAGPHRDRIVKTVEKILGDPKTYARMAHVRNPFGDGRAAERIAGILEKWFSARASLTLATGERNGRVPPKGARRGARR
jgi:UDP-N-acetylglucosamine 2-epimerase (non-hydrolysing)